MFRDDYRRMNDDTHASEKLIRRTVEACSAKTHRARSLMPVLAVMVCVLALLVIPRVLRPQGPAVAGDNPSQTPQPAAFTPIGHMTEFDGMTLRYLSSFTTQGSRYIMLTLQGDGVSEEMSLRFALSSEKTGQTFWVGTQQLDHDADRKLSTFVVAFHEEDMAEYSPIELRGDGWGFPAEAYDPKTFRMLPEDDRLTLTLLEYEHYHYQPMEEMALEELPVLYVSCKLPNAELIDPSDAEFRELEMKAELVGTPNWTEAPLCTPMEGYHIMTARNVDGERLIVETQVDAAYIAPLSNGPVELYAWLYLIPRGVEAHPWKSTGLYENVHASKYQTTWQGDETKRRYLQHTFPLDGIDLDKYMLGVYGFYQIDLPDNSRTLTFTLGE